jgi:myo-inositol 2-dehydrogenase/D-chiro-inositol 1-dehydrogenase/scyllo-inositol 2-dehydrogenase (NAD+)
MRQIIAVAEKEGVLLQLPCAGSIPSSWRLAQRISGDRPAMMIKSNTHGRPCRLRPRPAYPAACWAEVNSHDWDTTRWLMGSNYSRVYTEVANFKGAANGVDTENFYDNALVNLKFESGGLGLISGVCPCGYGYDARVEIIGEKGIMQIGSLQGQDVVVCTDRDHGLVSPIYRTWPERFEWGYINELQHFVSCIQDGSRPRVGGVEGRG